MSDPGTVELKPCPFCGRAPHIVKTIHGGFGLWHHQTQQGGSSCHVLGRLIAEGFEEKTLAATWNKRSKP